MVMRQSELQGWQTCRGSGNDCPLNDELRSNRMEFMGAMANAVFVGSYYQIRLRYPLIWKTKTEVVTDALALGVPVHKTYSCYEGGPKHCGLCPTCMERINAFRANKVRDPVLYEVPIDWDDWGCVAYEQRPLFPNIVA